MNLFRRVKNSWEKRVISQAVEDEKRLNELMVTAENRKASYDEQRLLHLSRLSELSREELEKGNLEPSHELIRGRILDKLAILDKEYRDEVVRDTREATYIKKGLERTYENKAIEKAVKDLVNEDRIGAAYDTIVEAYTQGKLEKDKFKEVRKNTEGRLSRQVHYSDAIVMDMLGRVLLLKRADGDDDMAGKWGLPGGHVDPGESHHQAAVRELNEEAGIEVDTANARKVAELNKDTAMIEYYRMDIGYNPIVIINVREHQDYEWVPVQDLNRYDTIGDLQEVFAKVFSYDLKPEIVEIRKSFSTILTAYFNNILDEQVVSDTYGVFLEKSESVAKGSPSKDKVATVMREFKEGNLKSGSGGKVTDRKQAIAIALSEAGLSKGVEKEENKKEEFYKKLYQFLLDENGEFNTYNSCRKVSKMDKYPKQIDTENCDIVAVYDTSAVILAGGDWQQGINIEIGLSDNGKIEIISVFKDHISQSKSEKREKLKEVKEIGEQDTITKSLEVLEIAYQNGQIPLDVLEKARTGVYADDAENRRLKCVGQKYGTKGEETSTPKEEGGKDSQPDSSQSIEEQAKQASSSALEHAAKEAKDPEVRTAAHKELDRRSKEEKVQEQVEGGEGRVTIESKVSSLKDSYKKHMEELFKPDNYANEKIYNKIEQQSREISRYLQRINQFNEINLPNEIENAEKLLSLKGEKELESLFGDGKLIAIKKFGDMTTMVLTKDMYCSRTFFEDGGVKMNEFLLDPSIEKGKGHGKQIFYNQVLQFKGIDKKYLSTDAAKSDIYNGYYTWARMGYDISDPHQKKKFLSLVKSSGNKDIAGVKSLPHLMSFPEGREFWKKNGFAFEGKFDLSDNSQSMFILTKYMEEKK